MNFFKPDMSNLKNHVQITDYGHPMKISKISEKLGRCGRQNMPRPWLKIWEWDWIFGCAVKAISPLSVHSPWVDRQSRVNAVSLEPNQLVSCYLAWSLPILDSHNKSCFNGNCWLNPSKFLFWSFLIINIHFSFQKDDITNCFTLLKDHQISWGFSGTIFDYNGA